MSIESIKGLIGLDDPRIPTAEDADGLLLHGIKNGTTHKVPIQTISNESSGPHEEETIASSINNLEQRVLALERALKESVFERMQIEEIDIQKLKVMGSDMILIGEGTPSEQPDFIGQIYVKTDTPHAIYMAAIDSAVSGWLQLS